MRIAAAITEAASSMSVLYLLRGSRVAQAMELLEQQLDAGVVRLHSLAERLPPRDREYIMETLRSIRDYRHLYPKRPSADIETVQPDLIESVNQNEEHARNILESL